MSFQCGRNTKTCSQCKRRYVAGTEEHLEACPACGFPRPCRTAVAREGQACRVHGGASPKGIAHPGFKHGKHSKVLKGDTLQRYEEARRDPLLVGLREEIALVDARLGDLLQGVMLGENELLWPRLKDAFRELKVAIRAKDPTGMATELSLLEQFIEQGSTRQDSWKGIYDVVEIRRKLVDTEWRRELASEQAMRANEAETMVVALATAVRLHVKDRDILAAIQDEFIRINGVAAGGRTGEGRREPLALDAESRPAD